MYKLSICIAVYNQLDILRNTLDSMLAYKGEDVEFIISDDCSTDRIRDLITTYNDKRVVYCRTDSNVGHDLNILHSIEKASAEFVCVLRSRDCLFADQISSIVNFLEKHPYMSYCVFSACDEDGVVKLAFSDKRYKKGVDAIRAHSNLFVHPSGNIYKKSLIDLSTLREHLEKSFSHKFGFCVHELIRMDLACKGDFFTSSIIAWKYVNSQKQKDVAVNSLNNGKSVYSPNLQMERFLCESNYLYNYIGCSKIERNLLFKNIIKKYYKAIAYSFKYINKNKALQNHYRFDEESYSSHLARKQFFSVLYSFIRDNECGYMFLVYALLLSIAFVLYYPIRDLLMKHFFDDYQIQKMYQTLKRL